VVLIYKCSYKETSYRKIVTHVIVNVIIRFSYFKVLLIMLSKLFFAIKH